MSVKKDPAFILLTRLVHFDHPSELYLASKTECSQILHSMEVPEQVGAGQLIIEGTTPQHTLAEILRKHVDALISIVHISGTLQQIPSPDQQEIASILGRYSSLKAVFLSGCASLSFIKALLLKDIPSVIATQYDEPNESATHMANSFYSQLGIGKSIRESFDHICEQFDGVGYYRAEYEFEYDQLKWDSINEDQMLHNIPWGLYILRDHLNQLNWRFPHTDRLIQMIPAEEPDPAPRRPKYRTPVIIGSALLLSLISVFLLYSFWTKEGIPQSQCPFPGDNAGNTTLMLPVFDQNQKIKDRLGYTDMLKEFLYDIGDIEDTEIKFKEIKDPSNIFLAIDRYIIDCYTDLMLWGEYKSVNDNMLRFSMNFVLPEIQRDSLIHGSFSCNISQNPASTQNKTAIKDLFYTVMGTALYEKQQYRAALGMFDKVSMENDTLYSTVAFKIAQSYSHLGVLDTAENFYSHVIKIMPDWEAAYNGRGSIYARTEKYEEAIRDYSYALAVASDFTEAFYNRGLVHYKLKQYEASRNDMIRVLELRPSHAEATGMIAATFAVEQNEDSFYYYLEEALKKEIDIEKLKRYTDVGSYQAEMRFRKLMSKY